MRTTDDGQQRPHPSDRTPRPDDCATRVNTDRVNLILNPLFRGLVASFGKRRNEHFDATPASPGQVVFLGDSITEQGLWDGWFPELRTLNRGISGETTVQVLGRLGNAINDPVAVSLLIGTNDLSNSKTIREPDGIAGRTEEIIARIQSGAPNAKILLNSVMPRTAWFAPRIRAVNERYAELAERRGVTYVDLWPALADETAALRTEFTADNLHLLPAGYRAWSEVLRPLLST